MRSVPLDEVQRVELEDSQLQEELHKALLALAQARDQAKKPVVITFEGMGEQRVRVGYIVETPIWKTSYRLLLPEKPEEPAKIQGWAIVENQTDNDKPNKPNKPVLYAPIEQAQRPGNGHRKTPGRCRAIETYLRPSAKSTGVILDEHQGRIDSSLEIQASFRIITICGHGHDG
jgi:hypothetical protein